MAADDWTKNETVSIPATGLRKTTIETGEDGIAWITYEVKDRANKTREWRCTLSVFIADNPAAAVAIGTVQTVAKAYFDGKLGFVAPA